MIPLHYSAAHLSINLLILLSPVIIIIKLAESRPVLSCSLQVQSVSSPWADPPNSIFSPYYYLYIVHNIHVPQSLLLLFDHLSNFLSTNQHFPCCFFKCLTEFTFIVQTCVRKITHTVFHDIQLQVKIDPFNFYHNLHSGFCLMFHYLPYIQLAYVLHLSL